MNRQDAAGRQTAESETLAWRLRRLRRLGGWHPLLTLALFGTALLVVLSTFADYGMSWDEPYAVVYGRNALAFFASLGADRAAAQGGVALRGAGFQLLVEGAAALFASEHALLIRRLLTPLVGLLGVAGCYRLGSLLGGPKVGWLAAALLLLTPVYYGHMFINPIDLPFAVANVWALFFGARCVQEWPRPRVSSLLFAALAIGLGTGTRVGGAFVLGYMCLLLAARLFAIVRAQGRTAGTRFVAVGLGPLLALFALSYAAMLALWPAALISPLRVPWAAVLQTAAYPKHEPVLLAGNVFWSDDLPWFYQLGYLLVQLPEQLLLAAPIGAAIVAVSLARNLRAGDVTAAVPGAMLLLACSAPLACACALHPVDYDGMRHVLFVVPPLACLAAAGILGLLARLELRPASCALVVALLAGSSVRTLSTMVELHPYQYVYYNSLAGGTAGARGRFELDYWVTSFGEAMRELALVLAREPGGGARGGRTQRLLVCGHAAVAYMYLPPNVVLSRDPERADFVLATTKWSCQDRYPGEIVAAVERMGTTFAVVKRLRPPLLTAAAAP